MIARSHSSNVKQTIDALRESDIYKFESGQRQASFPVPEYQRILDCINTIGQMFKALPSTYSEKDEESLEIISLFLYKRLSLGLRPGRHSIARQDGHIGAKRRQERIRRRVQVFASRTAYLETIDQLLSYLSWRDTNGAVIIFVPNVDFSAVLNEIVGIHRRTPTTFGPWRLMGKRGTTLSFE